MSTLSKDLRSKLEKAILVAREEATKGAKSALIALGVGDAKKPAHLNATEETLRKRLRARGRQAGDVLRPDESQETTHLEQECAYEHWHRMLFARFLIENELLMQPGSTLDVNFEHCEEEGKRLQVDPWEVAADYGQHMLPEVFRQDDPVLQLRLPPEFRNKLTAILNELSVEVFNADDALGWTYQFWQTKRKKEVNESGQKIGADELSPVTQLFTEDYMVDFLLDNTLGAWHAGKFLDANPKLAENAQSEDELRQAVALPDCPWKYLRFIKSKDGKWTPAAGTFDGWPKSAAALRALDPCMGSGHFVVAMFERLVALRIAEERLVEEGAVDAVIRDNLFGLEIDPRCTQIAAFNLALAAWRRVGYRMLPAMNLACSGLAPNTPEADWLAIAGDNQKLQRGMERLYRLFQKAAVLGSLINPRAGEGDLLVAAFHELQPLLEKVLAQETKDDTAHEMAVTACGLAKAAEILAGQFTLVATNVPYRGCNDLVPELKEFIEFAYPRGRTDLATCLFERCIELCANEGTTAVVSPQAWLFIGPYRRLREHLLKSTSFSFVAQLGKHAFATIGGEVVNVNLTAISKARVANASVFSSLDVSALLPLEAKATALLTEQVVSLGQLKQLENPDARIVTDMDRPTVLLNAFADSYKGIATGDMGRFIHYFWEHTPLGKVWSPLQGRVDVPADFGGREQVVLWENGRGQLHKFVSERLGENSVGAWLRGDQAWQHRGIAIGQMTTLPCTLYLGDLFDENTAAVIPKHEQDLPAMWAYCQSQEYRGEVKKLDNSSLKLPNLTLIKVPFDLAHWQKVAAEKYPDGLPKPFSSDPTQWLFNGHPAGADQPLHVAVARLLGYQWPRQTGSSFPDCPALGPDGFESFADEDGIVCLTSLRGEASASDRLREILNKALGAFDERQLIVSAGKKGSKAETLHDWLRDEFFEQHCDLFHQRPFIWHLWDGRKDGFHALVNYHKLAGPNGAGRRTLESLTYGYLGDWITRQRDAVTQGESGADDRLAAALELKGLLEQILAGEPPYDLFVRWKPLHEQAIGWEPDLNDGVRLNARPFLVTDLSRGKKDAGIFRSKVNLNWKKDRGTEPDRAKEDYPWFWNWDESKVDFIGIGSSANGSRWNDLHYTTAFKQQARKAHIEKGAGL